MKHFVVLLLFFTVACEQAATDAPPAAPTLAHTPTGTQMPTPAPSPLPRVSATPTAPTPTTTPPLAAVEVSEWLKQNSVGLKSLQLRGGFDDLSALTTLIGRARIVMVGEPTHGAHEFAQLRQHLLEWLVTEQGFNLLLIDAPWGDVLPLNEYVMNDRGDAQRLLGGLSGGWNSDEMLDTLSWLHVHNRNANFATRVRLYGFDFGSPATAMDAVENYLQRIDAQAFEQARARFACLRPYVRIQSSYAQLPLQVITECRGALQQTLDDLERNEQHRAQPPALREQAAMSVHVVLQTEDLMTLDENADTSELRARYQTENIARLMLADVKAIIWARTHQADLAARAPKSVAASLRERLGDDLRVIAFTMKEGQFMARSIGAQSASIRTATLPPGDSYEQAFGALDQPFVVDLRALPAHSPAAVWFNTPRPFRAVASHYDEANRATHFTAVALPRSFDAVAFVNEVTPAQTLFSGVASSSPFGPPRNLDFEDGTDGWWAFTGVPLQYSFGADRGTARNGAFSLALWHDGTTPPPTRRGMVGQTISASRYRGQRLRISAYVKTQNVQNKAGLIAALSPARTPTFALTVRDTMEGRSIQGTTDWQRYDIVVDVPNTEMSLAFGVWLEGMGKLWMDDVRLEVVGTDVPTTYGLGLPNAPRNLNFAEGTAAWGLDAISWVEWEFGIDRALTRNGQPSGYLQSKSDTPDGDALVQQLINAIPYRGKQVRWSAQVRSEKAEAGAGLGISASSQRNHWNAPRQPGVTGTSGWQSLEVTFDVPDTAEMIHLRFWLGGKGKMWVNALRFVVVEP